jgi:multidrug resistance efflux pump
MLLGFVLLFAYGFIVWLVFLQVPMAEVHHRLGILLDVLRSAPRIIFLLGLRYVAPASTEARVIQHTIQLVPRLPEPTLVTEVLVQPNVPVKKGQPLFQFDRRPYEYKVRQARGAARQGEAGRAGAEGGHCDQHAEDREDRGRSRIFEVPVEALDRACEGGRRAGRGRAEVGAQVAANQAGIKEAQAEETRARCATPPTSTA